LGAFVGLTTLVGALDASEGALDAAVGALDAAVGALEMTLGAVVGGVVEGFFEGALVAALGTAVGLKTGLLVGGVEAVSATWLKARPSVTRFMKLEERDDKTSAFASKDLLGVPRRFSSAAPATTNTNATTRSVKGVIVCAIFISPMCFYVAAVVDQSRAHPRMRAKFEGKKKRRLRCCCVSSLLFVYL